MQYASVIRRGATSTQLNALPTHKYIKDTYSADDAKYVCMYVCMYKIRYDKLYSILGGFVIDVDMTDALYIV